MNDDGQSERARTGGSGADVPLDEIPLHSTNLLTVLDERGVVQYESPSIERVFGFEQDALVGDQVAEYFHPEDREDVVEAFETVVSSEEYAVEAVEYRHERADGTYLWVESVASADPTPGGNYVVNTRDVSERKARERRLEATNERLDEFAAVVSHDIRNPLQIARARLELAREETDSEHLAEVVDAHDRMEALIEDVLSLARGERRVSRTEPVVLADVVAACWDAVPTADATLAVDGPLPTVEGSPRRLRRLFENLFRNAVEHAGPAPAIRVTRTEAGFAVCDDGPGIPPDEREDALSAGYTTRTEGTGLGLPIVARVAGAHGWSVEVETSDAGGARVHVVGAGRPAAGDR